MVVKKIQFSKLGGSDFERDFDDKSDEPKGNEPKDSKVDIKNIDSFDDKKVIDHIVRSKRWNSEMEQINIRTKLHERE